MNKSKCNIDVTLIHPLLRHKMLQLMKKCDNAKLPILITQGFRSVTEQDEMYKQGYSKAKGNTYSSSHQWGTAFDFALYYDVNKDGKVNSLDTYNDSYNDFKKIASIAKKLGLAWGGDWKSFVDRPHLYLPQFGDTPTKLKNKYSSPKIFFDSWKKKSNYKTGVRIFKSRTNKTVLAKIPVGKQCDILVEKKIYSKVGYTVNGIWIVGFSKTKYLK